MELGTAPLLKLRVKQHPAFDVFTCTFGGRLCLIGDGFQSFIEQYRLMEGTHMLDFCYEGGCMFSVIIQDRESSCEPDWYPAIKGYSYESTNIQLDEDYGEDEETPPANTGTHDQHTPIVECNGKWIVSFLQ